MRLSESVFFSFFGVIFGAVFTGFGINCVVRPDHALSFFYFEDLRVPGDQQLVDYLMIVYGARDIFMGVALWITLYFGSRKALGGTMIACGAIAIVDGIVCKMHGFGEWDHWGYSPMLVITGLVTMGVLDW
ncbi:hypothetical protein ZTR_06579 [Talaromyces verruculosus]|nr:hypothetical protein ZTR_06579 [Talaromyces verruculosus]